MNISSGIHEFHVFYGFTTGIKLFVIRILHIPYIIPNVCNNNWNNKQKVNAYEWNIDDDMAWVCVVLLLCVYKYCHGSHEQFDIIQIIFYQLCCCGCVTKILSTFFFFTLPLLLCTFGSFCCVFDGWKD